MHQGTFATPLLMLRSSSGKEVPNPFLFLTIFFLALQSFSPPLAFTLNTFPESDGSPLSLCLAPASRLHLS